jgi:hypothetical protein
LSSMRAEEPGTDRADRRAVDSRLAGKRSFPVTLTF